MSNSYELTTVQRESSCKPPTKQVPLDKKKWTSNGHGPVKANGTAVAVTNGGRKPLPPSDDNTAPKRNIFNRYNFKYIDDPDSTMGDDGVAHDSHDDQEDVVDASRSVQKLPTAKQQKNINNNDVKPLLANANIVQSNCDGGKGHEPQAAAANIANPQHNGDDAIDIMLERRAISGTPGDCHNGNFVIYIYIIVYAHIPIAISKEHAEFRLKTHNFKMYIHASS